MAEDGYFGAGLLAGQPRLCVLPEGRREVEAELRRAGQRVGDGRDVLRVHHKGVGLLGRQDARQEAARGRHVAPPLADSSLARTGVKSRSLPIRIGFQPQLNRIGRAPRLPRRLGGVARLFVHAGDDLDLQGGQRNASGHRPAIMRPPPRGVQPLHPATPLRPLRLFSVEGGHILRAPAYSPPVHCPYIHAGGCSGVAVVMERLRRSRLGCYTLPPTRV